MKFKLNGGLETVAIIAGAIMLLPVVLPVLGAVVKPLLKSGIKAGIILTDKTKVMIAEAKESVEDITAEVRAEMAQKNPVETVAEAAVPAAEG